MAIQMSFLDLIQKFQNAQNQPAAPASTGGSNTSGSATSGSTNTSSNTTQSGSTDTAITDQTTQVTPTKPDADHQINIADYAGQTATDPELGMTDEMLMGENLSEITDAQAQAGEVSNSALAGANASDLNQEAAQGQTSTAQQVDSRDAATYEAQTTQDAVEDAGMEAAQGQVSQEAQIDPNDFVIDTDAVARGETETGKALNDFATLELEDIPDEATLKGQLEELQSEFTDNDGNPRIPAWAAGQARNVSKIAAFTGMTGTAATAAMSQAIMEASVSVAQQDAKFFQTVALQNLNNEQASVINKANILSKMDLANMDSRLAAAVQNSKNFMDMDLANLSNEQQERVINTQARVQSILEDAKAVNTQRMFEAESQNDMNKFYDNLNASIDQFNSAQANAMEQFNVNEENGMAQFNANLESTRDKFYREMQYNIDVANAKWRQTITLQEDQQKHEAAALDVKNAVGISQEALNRLWDRSDALLDYVWKSSESELDRDAALVMAKFQANSASKAATKEGIGSVIGSVAGALVSNLDIFG